MDREIQQRLQWVRLYEETGNAGLVCHRCGISRPTLRKWWKDHIRYPFWREVVSFHSNYHIPW